MRRRRLSAVCSWLQEDILYFWAQMKLVTLFDLNLKDGVIPKSCCSRRYEIPLCCQSGRNMFVLVVDCNRTISHTALKCVVCFVMSAQKLDILFLAFYIVTSLK